MRYLMTGLALSSGCAVRAVASEGMTQVTSTRASRRPVRTDSAGNFPQVGNSDQAVLTGEREGLIAALGLCHAENPMIARVVNGDGPLIIDHQAAAVGEDSVSKIVLCATAPGLPIPVGHQSRDPEAER